MTSFVDPVLIKFITEHSLETRQDISNKLRLKYPDKVPLMIGRAELKTTPPINVNKYVIPGNSSVGELIIEIRKRITNLSSSQGLFFFLLNNTLPHVSMPLESLYNTHKSEDGFLYIVYACENTFG